MMKFETYISVLLVGFVVLVVLGFAIAKASDTEREQFFTAHRCYNVPHGYACEDGAVME